MDGDLHDTRGSDRDTRDGAQDRPGGDHEAPDEAREEQGSRDRDASGRARNARPRDGLGRPLPYGTPGVERQPEGVVRAPAESIAEAQQLLDAGKPFHAHEVFEDAWKTGPVAERPLWRGLAQLAVGLTHAARGNAKGGSRLLRRGAGALELWGATATRPRPHGLDTADLAVWARRLAGSLDRDASPVDAAAWAPRLSTSRTAPTAGGGTDSTGPSDAR